MADDDNEVLDLLDSDSDDGEATRAAPAARSGRQNLSIFGGNLMSDDDDDDDDDVFLPAAVTPAATPVAATPVRTPESDDDEDADDEALMQPVFTVSEPMRRRVAKVPAPSNGAGSSSAVDTGTFGDVSRRLGSGGRRASAVERAAMATGQEVSQVEGRTVRAVIRRARGSAVFDDESDSGEFEEGEAERAIVGVAASGAQVELGDLVPDMGAGSSGFDGMGEGLFEKEIDNDGELNVSKQEMESLLKSNHDSHDATTEMDTPVEVKEGIELKRHQKMGLNWMLRRETVEHAINQPRGGILSDDQG